MQTNHPTNTDLFISTDRSKLDITVIHNYLSTESYWAKNIPLQKVQLAIEHSFCFGIYKKEKEKLSGEMQIGFARIITDQATFGYLADVFILKEYRGLGLSKWLMETILEQEALQGFRSWLLATKDAYSLYEKFGFKTLETPGRFMRLTGVSEYPVAETK